MAKTISPVTARSRRPPPVLVCKKCLKRMPEGWKLKRALKSELKQRSRSEQTRRPRVVTTSCLGICPKHAVVVASATTLRRDELLLLSDKSSIIDAVTILTGDRPEI